MKLQRKLFLLLKFKIGIPENGHSLMNVLLYTRKKGILQTRRPDRVMMKDDQVVVVDFKFGKENPKYNKQVKGYMQLLTKMGYKNITSICNHFSN